MHKVYKFFEHFSSINKNINYFILASTRLLAATTLRNILGTKTLQEILQDKELISNKMQVSLN